jgi:hypothetical protein
MKDANTYRAVVSTAVGVGRSVRGRICNWDNRHWDCVVALLIPRRFWRNAL